MPTIKKINQIDWENSETLFKAFDRQKLFLKCVLSGNYRFILYGGSVRSGKTFSGLAAFIILSFRYPGSRWVVVRKDLQTIKRNTLPSWDKIKPLNYIISHNHETQTITFTNGSQIIFFGENYDKDKEFNRWRGLECNGFLLEEINELQEMAYFKAIERAGSYVIKGGEQPKPLILATCNPTRGWVKQRFYDKHKAGTLPATQIYIPANIKDNPYIPQEYIDSLQDLPRYERMVFVEGNWDVQLKTGGEFLKSFELDEHVAPAFFDNMQPVHVSLDENVQPYVTLTIWQMDLKHESGIKQVYQVGEILARAPNNTVKKLARSLVRWLRERDFTDIVLIYGDRTSLKQDTKLEKGQNFFNIFQREIEVGYNTRLRLPKVNPSVALSGDFVNAVFENNFDNLQITIGEHCKESISDYIETKEAADGGVAKIRVKDSITKVTYEENGHCTDTLRYFIAFAFKDSYLKYQSKVINMPRIIGKPARGRR